jgi:hypothetical protein
VKENSRKDIQEVDKLIKKCDECKLNECINCEISWTEVVSIKKITDEYKKILKMNEVLLKENKELKNIELKSKGGAIKISLEGVLSLENKIKQLEKEKKKLELEIKNREFSHMNLYNEYKYYKQFKSLSIETIKNKIEYLDKQQADWIEDRELKVSDSEIIFARDTLEKLLEDNYEKF